VFNCRGYDGVSETQGDRQRWIRLGYWRNTDGYRVAEIVADRRLQNLRNQVAHGAEPRNHFRSVVARNVNDLAHVQVEGESIRGAHRDRRELLVELVRLGRREGGDPGERAGPPADTCIPAGRLARCRFGAVPGAWTDRYGTERRWGLRRGIREWGQVQVCRLRRRRSAMRRCRSCRDFRRRRELRIRWQGGRLFCCATAMETRWRRTE